MEDDESIAPPPVEVRPSGRHIGEGRRPTWGSEETRQAHEDACDKARAAQTVLCAVAPSTTVETKEGNAGPGSEITPEMVGRGHYDDLVRRGFLIKLYAGEHALRQGAYAEFRAARAVSTLGRGIIAPGEEVTAEDFAPGALHPLIDKGYVVASPPQPKKRPPAVRASSTAGE